MGRVQLMVNTRRFSWMWLRFLFRIRCHFSLFVLLTSHHGESYSFLPEARGCKNVPKKWFAVPKGTTRYGTALEYWVTTVLPVQLE